MGVLGFAGGGGGSEPTWGAQFDGINALTRLGVALQKTGSLTTLPPLSEKVRAVLADRVNHWQSNPF